MSNSAVHYLFIINYSNSQEPTTKFGVPQGSVLWLVLFLVFINVLPEEVDCQVALFADDTLM